MASRKARIIVFGDYSWCDDLFTLVAKLVESLGYEVLPQRQAAAASEPADIVLAYLDLPHMRVLAEIRELQSQQYNRSTPIIVFVPKGLDQVRRCVIQAGATAIIDEPPSVSSIQRALSSQPPKRDCRGPAL